MMYFYVISLMFNRITFKWEETLSEDFFLFKNGGDYGANHTSN